jgi:hypothetical protein
MTRKSIPGYEGFYEADSNGSIHSLDRTVIHKNKSWTGREVQYRGRKLKSGKDKLGYNRVVLSKEGKVKSYLVSHLIALAFIGSRPVGMDVCHNDGNSSNDRLENLRYDSRTNNLLDMNKHRTSNAFRPMPCGEASGTHKLSSEDVISIRRQYKNAIPVSAIRKLYDVCECTIYRAIKGTTWAKL